MYDVVRLMPSNIFVYTVMHITLFSQIGTYPMAVMAKTFNKPFYVVTESFKFVRVFPLKQEDLPNQEKVSQPLLENSGISKQQTQALVSNQDRELVVKILYMPILQGIN